MRPEEKTETGIDQKQNRRKEPKKRRRATGGSRRKPKEGNVGETEEMVKGQDNLDGAGHGASGITMKQKTTKGRERDTPKEGGLPGETTGKPRKPPESEGIQRKGDRGPEEQGNRRPPKEGGGQSARGPSKEGGPKARPRDGGRRRREESE